MIHSFDIVELLGYKWEECGVSALQKATLARKADHCQVCRMHGPDEHET